MTKRSTEYVFLIGVVATTTLLAGCQSHLDVRKTEDAIKTGLAQQIQLPIGSVKCPESRPIKAGDTFDCTATAETGGDLNIKVTQKDDAGNINWELTNGDRVLSLTALEKVIKDGLAEQLKVDATVDCGGKMRVAIAGKTFECAAKTQSESRPVVVTMKDDTGNVSWALK